MLVQRLKSGNLVPIAFILLLSLLFLSSIVSTSRIMDNVHHANDVTFVSQNIKESVLEHGQLHLWTPYYYSGQPLYAQPEYYFLDLNFVYILLFRNIYMAMNLAAITYFFLAGLGMYLLFLVFSGSRKGALIAAMVYMLNGYVHSFVITGNLNVLAGYSLVPFAFMFFVKALKSDNLHGTIKNSVFSALFITLQLFAGGTLLIPYEIILFGIYSLFHLFGKDAKSRVLKLLGAGILVIFLSFGLSAVKLLPGLEFMDLSNRSAGISYQEYLGDPIQFSNIIHILITNLFSSGISASAGIMGFILVLFSILHIRKRYVAFSLALALFSLFMAAKGPIADLFFNLPLFDQLRHIERAVFLAAFAFSILCGAGFSVFYSKISQFVKVRENVAIFVVIVLILSELLLLQPFPKSREIIDAKSIPINGYISKDDEMFRTINLGLSTLIGASGYNYLSQLGIGTIKGGGGIWFNDYLAYLSIAEQTSPAKLWGILNNKYVISDRELDIEGLGFIGKFDECPECPIGEVDGPYLYENLEFMPRAYFVDKAILVIGEDADNIIYPLLLNDGFDPKKAVLIKGKESASQYTMEELKKYYAVIITGTISPDDINILRNYEGIVLPRIFEGRNSIDESDVVELFSLDNDSFEKIEIIEYETNRVSYNVGKKGFLVMSERFSNFPGWEADGKEILRANGIISAVLVEDDNIITLEYRPKSFRNGLLISALSLIIVLGYFLFIRFGGGKNKG